MTFSIINVTSNKVISRSNVRPAGETTSPNLRIDHLTAPEVVKSRDLPSNYLEDNEEASADSEKESPDTSTSSPKHDMPIIDPNDLVGRTFLFHKNMVNV